MVTELLVTRPKLKDVVQCPLERWLDTERGSLLNTATTTAVYIRHERNLRVPTPKMASYPDAAALR